MRAATSSGSEWARPQQTEPSVKTTIAARNTVRAPNRSADPAAERDEDGEAQQIGGDREVEAERVLVQRPRDRRQRGGDHRRIQVLHEQRAGDDQRHQHMAERGGRHWPRYRRFSPPWQPAGRRAALRPPVRPSEPAGRAVGELQRGEPRVKPALRGSARDACPAATMRPSSITTMRSALQHGGEAVGDDQGGAACDEALQRLLHQRARIRHRARRSPRPAAGSRGLRSMARAIAMRWRWPPDRRTPFSPRKVSKPSRQALDEFGRRGGLGGGADLGVARLGTAIADIVRRPRRRRSPGPAARGRCGGAARAGSAAAMSTPSTRTRPRARIVEAQQQLEHRRLAGARRADQRHRLARRDREREIVERRRAPAARDSGR